MPQKTFIAVFFFSLSIGALGLGCKKKEPKDDCYDNNKAKACEMKCARGEKKACSRWCHYTETEEACQKACEYKDQDSCKKFKTLKTEKKNADKKEKKSEKQEKAIEPYCVQGCNEGLKGKVSTNYGTLIWTKLSAATSSSGKAPTVASCTEKCVEEMLAGCPKPDFKKQYEAPCSKLK